MTRSEFRAARLRLGMSQGAFATAIGMVGKHARRHVRAWEKGEEDIPPHIVDKVRNIEPMSPYAWSGLNVFKDAP